MKNDVTSETILKMLKQRHGFTTVVKRVPFEATIAGENSIEITGEKLKAPRTIVCSTLEQLVESFNRLRPEDRYNRSHPEYKDNGNGSYFVALAAATETHLF